MRRYHRPKRYIGLKIISFFVLLAMAVLSVNYLRPLPQSAASIVSITSEVEAMHVEWPNTSAALGARGFGPLSVNGSQMPRPTASIAKIISVLAILEKQPLTTGQHGPAILITKNDMALFEKYYAIGGSVVKVEAGGSLSEYQALQAMLLPSANNMADTAAIWAFGSLDNYISYANDMVKRMGMSDTVVATDASGMSPNTVSTPRDLVRLGEYALSHPVIAEIVQQKSATIPMAGTISSANARLGINNIIGIKTGLTDQAGGCFLFAADETVEGEKVTIIGVIMGAKTLAAALQQSDPLLNSAKPYFQRKTVIKAGEVFATYTTPWGTTADVVAQKDVSLMTWKGNTLTPQIKMERLTHAMAASGQVGIGTVASGTNVASTPLVLKEPITGPTWQWRLTRL